jgi:hypothetical protein
MRTVFDLPLWVKRLSEPSTQIPQPASEDPDWLKTATPQVSIILLAGDKAHELQRTIHSLEAGLSNELDYELLVVQSSRMHLRFKSSLPIREIDASGPIQHPRQVGLEAALGKYVLTADAGTLYPPNWGAEFLSVMQEEPEVTCVYGAHSFIPRSGLNRFFLGCYRFLTLPFQNWRSVSRECSLVFGFNMAFRRMDALRVGGYPANRELDRKRRRESEDGRLALRLSRFGLLRHVDSESSRVWISSRRLHSEGGFIRRILRKLGRELGWLNSGQRSIVVD